MRQITVYSDYVCPYCLLAEQVLSQAIGERDIRISWRAFELRPEPAPTLRTDAPYLPSVWRKSVYPLAERLGVPIQLPSISPQPRTAKAFQLLALAQDSGLDHAYSMRVLRAFFQEDRDIGDDEILITLAGEVGLDQDEARSVLEDGVHAERHQEALRHAREDVAIPSVPTIVVGKRVLRGMPPLQELEAALDQLDQAMGPENQSNQTITGD